MQREIRMSLAEVTDDRVSIFVRQVESPRSGCIESLYGAVDPGGTVMVDHQISVKLFQLLFSISVDRVGPLT